MAKVDSNYYPETLHRMFIVNAGPTFKKCLWPAAQKFLDAKTIAKIQVTECLANCTFLFLTPIARTVCDNIPLGVIKNPMNPINPNGLGWVGLIFCLGWVGLKIFKPPTLGWVVKTTPNRSTRAVSTPTSSYISSINISCV